MAKKTLNNSNAIIQAGFTSSSGLTPEFKAFATQFRAAIKAELATIGAELVSFNRGHFDISGFYKRDDNIAYFSLPDVRSGRPNKVNQLMFRTAKHTKDYSGGSNQWCELTEGAGMKMARALG